MGYLVDNLTALVAIAGTLFAIVILVLVFIQEEKDFLHAKIHADDEEV